MLIIGRGCREGVGGPASALLSVMTKRETYDHRVYQTATLLMIGSCFLLVRLREVVLSVARLTLSKDGIDGTSLGSCLAMNAPSTVILFRPAEPGSETNESAVCGSVSSLIARAFEDD